MTGGATINMPPDEYNGMVSAMFHLGLHVLIDNFVRLIMLVTIVCLWWLSRFVGESLCSENCDKFVEVTFGCLLLASQLSKASNRDGYTIMLERYLANFFFRLNNRVYLPLNSNSGTFRLLTI